MENGVGDRERSEMIFVPFLYLFLKLCTTQVFDFVFPFVFGSTFYLPPLPGVPLFPILLFSLSFSFLPHLSSCLLFFFPGDGIN